MFGVNRCAGAGNALCSDPHTGIELASATHSASTGSLPHSLSTISSFTGVPASPNDILSRPDAPSAAPSRCGSTARRLFDEVSREGADAALAGDPQDVPEYALDVHMKLTSQESNSLPRADYMQDQPDINPAMRAILIDWFVEVQVKFKMGDRTLYLAINIVDRFLARRRILKRNLQLLGVTSMSIASKFEEIYPPELRDFEWIAKDTSTKEQIQAMEAVVLTAIEFSLCCPTPVHFLQRFARANGCDDRHAFLAMFLLELSMTELDMVRFPPSHLVSAALLLSNKLLRRSPSWTPGMEAATGFDECTLGTCACAMCAVFEASSSSQYPYQAVRRKYSLPQYHAVATATWF